MAFDFLLKINTLRAHVCVCVCVCVCMHAVWCVTVCVCGCVSACKHVCVSHNVCVSACHSACQLIILWTEKAAHYKTSHHFLRPSCPIYCPKLQALVYYILPYAIGPRKLSANEQFFVGAQTVVSLLQTTQIISDVCFIMDHVLMPRVYVHAWVLGCFHSPISTQTSHQGHWPHWWTAARR